MQWTPITWLTEYRNKFSTVFPQKVNITQENKSCSAWTKDNMLDMSRGSTWAFLVSLQRSITTSLSPVILHKLHLQSYAQQQPPSFAIYNVSSSQLSIPAPTFSPATIITISALISTHALSFRQPSMYCNLQYYPPFWHWTTDIVDTGTVASPIYDTVKCLLSIHSCQMLNVPWYKSSSTFSSKFFDSWKYSSSTQCPSSLLWTHWLANNEGPFTDRWRNWQKTDLTLSLSQSHSLSSTHSCHTEQLLF